MLNNRQEAALLQICSVLLMCLQICRFLSLVLISFMSIDLVQNCHAIQSIVDGISLGVQIFHTVPFSKFLAEMRSIPMRSDETVGNGRKRYIILLLFSKTNGNGREIFIFMNSSI